MPTGFDPNDEASFSLDADIAKYPDEKTRPTFYVPFYPARELMKIGKKLREIYKRYNAEKDDDQRLDILVEAARLVISRWANMPPHPKVGELTWDNMADALTFRSLNELTEKMEVAPRLSEIDRGKSAAQPQSGGETAAPIAAKPAAA